MITLAWIAMSISILNALLVPYMFGTSLGKCDYTTFVRKTLEAVIMTLLCLRVIGII
jgi:hypothetical protein